jgi:hypothetical protein
MSFIWTFLIYWQSFKSMNFSSVTSPPLPPPRGRRCERSDGATATALEFTALPATANNPPPPSAPCRQQHRQWRKHTFPCNHSSVAPSRENQPIFYRSLFGVEYNNFPYRTDATILSDRVRQRKSNEGIDSLLLECTVLCVPSTPSHPRPTPPHPRQHMQAFRCTLGEERLRERSPLSLY